jgi:hypothetical protein
VVFREASYRMIVRKAREVEPDDPLGSLLWYCGLDPRDDEVQSRPWDRLSRALGGSGGTPEAVKSRLEERRDKRLAALLDDARAVGPRLTPGWPPFWQYVLPDQDEVEMFVLQRSDGFARVAVGTLDATAQSDASLTLGDGNLLWATLQPTDEFERIQDLCDAPPSGLVPSARKGSWIRWLRAEHAGRRAALLGEDWVIDVDSDGWRLRGSTFGELTAALLSLRLDDRTVCDAPTTRVERPYPRTGLAFTGLVRRARGAGLRALRGAGTEGYEAEFESRTATGACLVDVLGCR